MLHRGVILEEEMMTSLAPPPHYNHARFQTPPLNLLSIPHLLCI